MGKTPTYTIYFPNGHWLEIEMGPDQYVKLRPDGLIITNPDPSTGHRKFPYASMTHYDVTYPDTKRVRKAERQERAERAEELHNARMRQRTEDRMTFIRHLHEAHMCTLFFMEDGPGCNLQPVIHARHGTFEPLKIRKESIDEVARVTEQVAKEREANDRRLSDGPPFGAVHNGDIVVPHPADLPWPLGNGPALGRPSDVPERAPED